MSESNPVAGMLGFVSVGSARFSAEALRGLEDLARSLHHRVEWVVLEGPERYNIMAMESVDEQTATSLAVDRAKLFRERIGLTSSVASRWNAFLGAERFEEALSRVETGFAELRTFRAACINQTFSNLLPRFRRAGIERKTDPRVRVASSYLREELAAKLAAYESGLWAGEVMPVPEMKLVRDMYRGRYFAVQRPRRPYTIAWPGEGGDSRGVAMEEAGEVDLGV